MIITVNKSNISVDLSDVINEKEYKANKLYFEFTEEYENLRKVAVFTKGNNSYKEIIVDNMCDIPYEVLENKEAITFGVYAEEIVDDEILLRYSPSPIKLFIADGSYVDEALNTIEVTPSEYEQYLAVLDGKFNEVNHIINSGELNGATFTPTVSTDGDLSWDNDKGLPNPETVNIRGPQGIPGHTPQKGVDYWTQEDKNEVIAYCVQAVANRVGYIEDGLSDLFTVSDVN